MGLFQTLTMGLFGKITETGGTIMRDKNTGKMDLQGFRVTILVTDGFEQVELEDPRKALQVAGAETVVASPKTGTVQGMNHDEKGGKVKRGCPNQRSGTRRL
jgi:putative intracellular protease/amidase